MLVGDIIHQMLSDPRIKALTDDHAMPAHGSPAHGSPAHGMHGTDENNINLNNNISVADQSMKARCRFQKPSVEEVDAYCRQRQNHVDASRFWDFYESKGWKVGKSKMVACRLQGSAFL